MNSVYVSFKLEQEVADELLSKFEAQRKGGVEFKGEYFGKVFKELLEGAEKDIKGEKIFQEDPSQAQVEQNDPSTKIIQDVLEEKKAFDWRKLKPLLWIMGACILLYLIYWLAKRYFLKMLFEE